MTLKTLKLTIGRRVVRSALVRKLMHIFLTTRAKWASGQYIAVLSMGEQGHSYSACRAARALGYQVLLITDTPQVHEMAYANAVLPLDPLTDLEEILLRLESFRLIAVVVSIKHLLLPAQSAIAEKFALISTGPETGIYNNDKFAWRNALTRAGVPQPEYSTEPEMFENRACIRKPRSGTGSAHVSLLSAEDEKLTAVERASGVEFFFEEFVEGDQYDIEGVVENGEPRILCRVYEKYILVTGTFVPHYFLFNSSIDAERVAVLDSCMRETLDASRVINGAFHIEMRMRGDQAVPIDFANRMGYERLMSLASGEDFAQAHVNCFLPKKVAPKRSEKQAVIQFFCWTEEHRDLVKAKMREFPTHVFDHYMLPHTFASRPCLGMVTFMADTQADLAHVIDGLNVMASSEGSAV